MVKTLMRASLTELCDRYGSDKGYCGPRDTWGGHAYSEIYESYLNTIRDAEINILEIGIGVTGDNYKVGIATDRNVEGGASIRAFLDYFPNASIFAVDINDASHITHPRLKTFVCDQGSESDMVDLLKSIGIMFDAIIDDGSHRPDHQQVSFKVAFNWLKSGGLYFIEDLKNNGFGDKELGRSHVNTVLNTAKLFRMLRSENVWAEPNLIGEGNLFVSEIESISFYCPTRIDGKGSRRSQFNVNSEKLLVVRKAL
jgi:hypothetical protein